MHIGTDLITRCLTCDLNYCINNYGEKKIDILTDFHSPSILVFPCQFIFPQSYHRRYTAYMPTASINNPIQI